MSDQKNTIEVCVLKFNEKDTLGNLYAVDSVKISDFIKMKQKGEIIDFRINDIGVFVQKQSEQKTFTPVLNKVSQSEEYKKFVNELNEMDKEFKEKINKHDIKFPSAYIKFPFQNIHEDPIELKNFEFHQLNFFAKGYNPVLMHEAKIPSGKYLQVSISGDIDEEIRNEVRNLIKEIELRYKI